MGAREPLVRQAQDGDKAAFEQLYRKHAGRVYALCLRLSADHARAEELTQDIFVRAWQTLRSFRGDSAFSSWLYRLAMNLVLSVMRSERRQGARFTTTDELSELECANPSSTLGTGIDLEQAIRSLPTGARTVFVLHDVEGYKHNEIAKITGLAPGTSKAQLHRARKLLREALER